MANANAIEDLVVNIEETIMHLNDLERKMRRQDRRKATICKGNARKNSIESEYIVPNAKEVGYYRNGNPYKTSYRKPKYDVMPSHHDGKEFGRCAFVDDGKEIDEPISPEDAFIERVNHNMEVLAEESGRTVILEVKAYNYMNGDLVDIGYASCAENALEMFRNAARFAAWYTVEWEEYDYDSDSDVTKSATLFMDMYTSAYLLVNDVCVY